MIQIWSQLLLTCRHQLDKRRNCQSIEYGHCLSSRPARKERKSLFVGALLIWADLAQNLCLERWIGSDCRHHGRALLLADDSYAEVEVHHGPCHHVDVNMVNITMVNVNMVNVNIMVGPALLRR